MTLEESVNRVLQAKTLFGERFYEAFFEACPAANVHFRDVDLRRQAVLLTMQLMIVKEHYLHKKPAVEAYLRILGTKHHDRGIPRELYPDFGRVLLRTLAEFHGAEWTPALEKEWSDAVNRSVHTMLEGYEQHFML